MKKRILALFLSAGLILGSAPVHVFAEESTEEESVSDSISEIQIEDPVLSENQIITENNSESAEETQIKELFDETEGEEETISGKDLHDSYVESMPSNEELMEGYIQQVFSTEAISLLSSNEIGPVLLSDDSLTVYNYMAEEIKNIASGDNDQTIIRIPYSLLVDTMSMTSEEMGQTWTIDENNTVQGIDYSPLFAQLDVDFPLVMDCLLRDFPYEMYWYDKTQGFMYTSAGASATIYQSGSKVYGNISFAENACYTLTLSVSDSYKKTDSLSAVSSSGKQFFYEVNTSNITRVNTALDHAESILNNLKTKDDYSKLLGYKEAICEMADYNHPAADNNDTPFGDPWQMVYVFDGDPATKVVCEGYSKGFQYLCNKTAFSSPEIMCYLVTGNMQGNAGTPEGHMWNIVHMDDGNNYIADITNSDEGSVGSEGGLFLNGMTYMSDHECYTANSMHGNSHVYYWYDEDTKNLFSEEQLSLSGTDYIYTGSTTGGEDETDTDVRITGMNLSLFDNGKIGLNYYLSVSEDADVSNITATTSYESSSNTTCLKDLIPSGQTIDRSDDGNEKTYNTYTLSNSLSAAEMTVPVKLEVAANDSVVEVTENAISDYAKIIIEDENYYEYVDVVKAMLNYGSAAQIYFNTNTENLANDYLSDADKEIKEIDEGYLIYPLDMYGEIDTFSYIGSSLVLDSELAIRHYFTIDEATQIEDYSFSVNDEEVEATLVGSMYYIEVTNISLSDLHYWHSVEITKGYDYIHLNYNAMVYMTKYFSSDRDDNLGNLLCTLFAYNRAFVWSVSGTYAYTDHGDGTCSIDGYTGRTVGDLNIPNEINGLTVTEISPYAFSDCQWITGNIVIPDSVTMIGKYAFYNCKNAKGTLTLSQKLKTIDEYAFYKCEKLAGELQLSSEIDVIGMKAFSYCGSLKGDLVIPDGITTCDWFDHTGFDGDLILSDSMTYDESFASTSAEATNFKGVRVSENSMNYSSKDNVLYSKDYTVCIWCPKNNTCEVFISDACLKICSFAFYNTCGSMQILLPDSVTIYGESAFENCAGNIESLNLNEDTGVGEAAFNNTVVNTIVYGDISKNTFHNFAENLKFTLLKHSQYFGL